MLSGDQMEVEIRAMSIYAVELLRGELDKLMAAAVVDNDGDDQKKANESEPINSIVLDFYLWNFRRDHQDAIEQTVPFHRVRSINY